MSLPRTAVAFLRREFLEEASYPLKVVFGFGAAIVSIGFLVIFADFVGATMAGSGEGRMAHGYLPFALVGLSFHTLLDTALRELSSRIRRAQMQGTFEALLATSTPLPVLMLALPLYPLLRTCSRFVLLLLFGWLVLDVPLSFGNWPVVLVAFGLAVTVFTAIGLVFAGLTVVFKQTEPLIAVFNASCFFLGGVIVPSGELPAVLQWVGVLLPITPALEAFRIAAIDGGDFAAAGPVLGQLAVFAVVLVPFSVVVFRWSIRQALRDGSLGHY